MTDDVKARYWNEKEDSTVECELCPHHCRIPPDNTGLCGVRRNVNGTLVSDGYGLYPAIHMDPIEKKPLNHFLPGNNILSAGSVGCNLTCRHCQNWSLARAYADSVPGPRISPSRLVEMAESRNSAGVAFTYNEPSINFEFIMDCAPLLGDKKLKNVLVTNGFLEREPWGELMDHTNAANIDVKGFTEEFYRTVTGGKLSTVIDNVKTAFRKDVHIEIAYLVIPGYNDDGQVDEFMDWMISDVSGDVPVHFNRFHPDHKMSDVPPTPEKTLLDILERAKGKGMKHVFIGNMPGASLNNTVCPKCKKTIIKREGLFGSKNSIRDGKCPKCGTPIYGVWD